MGFIGWVSLDRFHWIGFIFSFWCACLLLCIVCCAPNVCNDMCASLKEVGKKLGGSWEEVGRKSGGSWEGV